MEINEEVKTKMLEYLQQFESGVKSAAEFSAAQAPIVVHEFLAWEFTSNAVASCFLGLLVLGTVIVAKRISSKAEGEDRFFTWLFATIPLVIFSAGFCASLHGAGKVYVAPRVVVLEKISSLME